MFWSPRSYGAITETHSQWVSTDKNGMNETNEFPVSLHELISVSVALLHFYNFTRIIPRQNALTRVDKLFDTSAAITSKTIIIDVHRMEPKRRRWIDGWTQNGSTRIRHIVIFVFFFVVSPFLFPE